MICYISHSYRYVINTYAIKCIVHLTYHFEVNRYRNMSYTYYIMNRHNSYTSDIGDYIIM